MEDFNLKNFLKINSIELEDSYKKSDEAFMALIEMKEILVLKKIKEDRSFSNRIYLNILLKKSPLYSHLNQKTKLKNLFWITIGSILGYRI